MRRVPIATAAVIALVGLAAPWALAGDVGIRVVGGTAALSGEWPSITPLLRSGVEPASAALRCGGTVIAARWVMTAAHCVVDGGITWSPASLQVAPGALDLNAVTAANRVGISRVVPHPRYNPANTTYDFALLQTSAAISAPPMPMVSPVGDASVVAGAQSASAGWGRTTYPNGDGASTSTLQRADLPIISDATCADDYKNNGGVDATTEVCAGFQNGGHDTCQGDSGGPLALGIGGTATLVGIVSRGVGCALANFPGIYARVAAARDWACDWVTSPAAITVSAASRAAEVAWTPDGTCPWRDPVVTVVASPGGATATAPLSAGRAGVPGLDAGATYLVSAYIASASGATPDAATASVMSLGQPVATLAPTVAGTAKVGDRLTMTPATWSAVPVPATSIRWQRRTGTSWIDIPGTTAARYRPVAFDRGHALRGVASASNDLGSGESASSATRSVLMKAVLASRTAPPISGRPAVGRRLTAAKPVLTAYPVPVVTRAWQRRSGRAWTSIQRATKRTYLPVAADLGHALRVRYTARNAAGTRVLLSAVTRAVS